MKVDGYNVNTKSSTDYGLSSNLGAVWTNPNSKSKINNVWTSVKAGFENQNLHTGGFNQATERTKMFQATAGMDINKGTSLTLNYSQNNFLNSSKNNKNFWATLGIKL